MCALDLHGISSRQINSNPPFKRDKRSCGGCTPSCLMTNPQSPDLGSWIKLWDSFLVIIRKLSPNDNQCFFLCLYMELCCITTCATQSELLTNYNYLLKGKANTCTRSHSLVKTGKNMTQCAYSESFQNNFIAHISVHLNNYGNMKWLHLTSRQYFSHYAWFVYERALVSSKDLLTDRNSCGSSSVQKRWSRIFKRFRPNIRIVKKWTTTNLMIWWDDVVWLSQKPKILLGVSCLWRRWNVCCDWRVRAETTSMDACCTLPVVHAASGGVHFSAHIRPFNTNWA